MSRIGKKAIVLPKVVSASVDAQTVKVAGPKGELSQAGARSHRHVDDHGIHVAPRKEMKAAPQMWPVAHPGQQFGDWRYPGFTQKLETRASAIAPRCRARC
jgi:large subunit ribosomal protein L6